MSTEIERASRAFEEVAERLPTLLNLEMCRLQGLPEDYLDHAPWTSDAKRRAIANGVPLPMGRAIARAVKRAMGYEAAA